MPTPPDRALRAHRSAPAAPATRRAPGRRSGIRYVRPPALSRRRRDRRRRYRLPPARTRSTVRALPAGRCDGAEARAAEHHQLFLRHAAGGIARAEQRPRPWRLRRALASSATSPRLTPEHLAVGGRQQRRLPRGRRKPALNWLARSSRPARLATIASRLIAWSRILAADVAPTARPSSASLRSIPRSIARRDDPRDANRAGKRPQRRQLRQSSRFRKPKDCASRGQRRQPDDIDDKRDSGAAHPNRR